MSPRRRSLPLRVVALAATALVTLAGCSLVVERNDLGLPDEGAMTSVLDRLTQRLEPIPGVGTVTATTELTGYSYQVTVQVSADGLEQTGALAVLAALDEELDDPVFDDQQVYAQIDAYDTPADVTAFGLGGDRLTREVQYWFDLAGVVGAPVRLRLDPTSDGFRRTLTAVGLPGPVDWEALTALVDSSDAVRGWSLPGLEAVGSLPGPDVVALLHALESAVPASDPANTTVPGFTLAYEDGHVSVMLVSPTVEGVAPAASEDWPVMLAVTRAVLGAGIPVANLSYSATESGAGGAVHLAACPTEAGATEDDEVLFAALAASGVSLPGPAGAGYCGVAPAAG